MHEIPLEVRYKKKLFLYVGVYKKKRRTATEKKSKRINVTYVGVYFTVF